MLSNITKYIKMLSITSIVLYVAHRIELLKYINLNDDISRILLFSLSSTIITPVIQELYRQISLIISLLFVSSIVISKKTDQLEIYTAVKFYIDSKYSKNNIYTGQIKCQKVEDSTLSKILYKNNGMFTVGLGWHMIIENGMPIIIHINERLLESNIYSSYEHTIILYSIFPFHSFKSRHNIWKEFISNAKNYYKKNKKIYVEVQNLVNNGNYQLNYIEKNDMNKKTDFVMTNEMNKLNNHIKIFMESTTSTYYKVCVYGPPGTGKSKMVYKIALDYNLPVYHIHNTMATTSIINMFHFKTKGIIVIDEIEMFLREARGYIAKNDNDEQCALNIPSLHGLLDNIVNKKKLIIYFTTNNVNILRNINGGSIIRPERIDLLLKFGYIDNDLVNGLLKKTLNIEVEIPEYNKKILKLTPSKIINMIKLYNYNKELIIGGIHELINKSTTKKKITKNKIEDILNIILEKYNIIISQKYISHIVNILYLDDVDSMEDCINILKNNNYNENIKSCDKVTIFEKMVIEDFIKKLKYYHINDVINDIIKLGKSNEIIFSSDIYCNVGDFMLNNGVTSIVDFKKCIDVISKDSTIKKCDISKLENIITLL